MAALGGIASFRSNGRQYLLRGECTVSPSSTERTGVAGMDGVHGYVEAHRVPGINVTLSTTPEVTNEDLEAIDGDTVQVDLNNGQSYVLHEAWCRNGLEHNTMQGSMAVRFEGTSCEPI